jgi:hypothetical protein
MYVTLALSALLILALAYLAAYYVRSGQQARNARRQQAAAARLHAVAAQATKEHDERNAAAQASAALTTVLPCISKGSSEPRHVA